MEGRLMTEKQRNKKEYHSVILAALLHDIGKFIQRQSNVTARSKHSEFSKDFFSQEEGFRALWLRDDIDLELMETIIKNHHDRIIQETRKEGGFRNKREEALCQLVSDADTFSAGERHRKAQRNRIYFTKRPLDPIFSQVELFHNPPATYSPYKIGVLSPKGAFPEGQKEIEEGRIMSHYKNSFIPELKEINASQFDEFYCSLLSLLEKYTWCLPSDTTKEIADISLYDHLKTTSALTACLYRFHEQDIEGYLSSPKNEYKLRLIGGDLSGIQDYIFKITDKSKGGVAKRLRSRSFYLSTLIEVTVQKILHSLELPISCNLISTGGRFVLLTPENIGDQIKEVQNEISTWLFEKFFGQLTINLDWSVRIIGYNLKIGEFFQYMEQVCEKLELNKRRKNSEILLNTKWNEEKFIRESQYEAYNQEKEGAKDCQICHCFPANRKDRDGTKICSQCAEDKKVGQKLPKTEYIAFGKAKIDQLDKIKKDITFFDSKNNEYDAYFVKLISRDNSLPQINNHYYLLYRLYDSNEEKKEKVANLGIMNKFFANHVPLYKDLGDDRRELVEDDQEKNSDSILTFGTLAALSQWENKENKWKGVKRLGLLKADIDRLGLILNRGLQKDVTVSRYLTMSRMIDLFFAGWVEETLSIKYQEIYAVFSGGDDLFLVGPWERIIEFSEELYKNFRSFTCQNKNITLSAGIAILKPKFPIARGAKLVDELLEISKSGGQGTIISETTDADKEGRNCLTLFGTTLKWNELEKVIPFKDLLLDELKKKDSPFTTSFLHRLLKYHQMYLNVKSKGMVKDLLYRSKMAYDIARNLRKEAKDKQKVEKQLMEWLEYLYANDQGVKNELMENIKIPVFWALYKNRRYKI